MILRKSIYLGRLSLPIDISESAWLLPGKEDTHRVVSGDEKNTLISVFRPRCWHQEVWSDLGFYTPLERPSKIIDDNIGASCPKE